MQGLIVTLVLSTIPPSSWTRLGKLNDSYGTVFMWAQESEFGTLSFLIFLGKIVKHTQYDQEVDAFCLVVLNCCHVFFIVYMFCFPKIKSLYVCCLYMHIHIVCSMPMRIISPRTRVLDDCEHHGCWKLNLDPLQKQPELLATEPSLQL